MYLVGCKDNDFLANNVDFMGLQYFLSENLLSLLL